MVVGIKVGENCVLIKKCRLKSNPYCNYFLGFPNPPSSEDPYTPTCIDPDTLGHGRQGAGLSPCLDGMHQESDLNVLLRCRGLLDEGEVVMKASLPVSPPLGRNPALRRSLSWPEDLSARDAAEQKAVAFSPDEPLISPEGPETPLSLIESAQPDMDVLVSGMRKLGISAARVTPSDVTRVGCPVSRPGRWPSKPESPEAHITHVSRFRHLNEVPKTSLKSLSLTFQQASPQANQGLNTASGSAAKRKGDRRFGRSISHESNLPLRSEETRAGSTTKREAAGVPHKSPLQSFKACGQQIFLTRKHIAMSFTGLRRKKEVLPPSARDPEVSAAISKEPILEHCKFSWAEMQF